MGTRKETIFLALSGKVGKFNFDISRDINGRSRGIFSQFSYDKMTLISEDLLMKTSFNLKWQDDRYAEYFLESKAKKSLLQGKNITYRIFFSRELVLCPSIKYGIIFHLLV